MGRWSGAYIYPGVSAPFITFQGSRELRTPLFGVSPASELDSIDPREAVIPGLEHI